MPGISSSPPPKYEDDPMAVQERLLTPIMKTLLPTPQRFHYTFYMLRELSRVVQGFTDTPIEVLSSESRLVSLWRHECIAHLLINCFGK